ncbi:uncharacterized protein LOC110012837 [Sesamum indicum]|uniref:Uncharacterized protein LOC110012837 n=1 Tax=Sesamum indicum TaxID=4182 RepID=A0A8M8V3D4_SESIN|nr:uncharacterized protein LOC110012837 [Sesamum indicum]
MTLIQRLSSHSSPLGSPDSVWEEKLCDDFSGYVKSRCISTIWVFPLPHSKDSHKNSIASLSAPPVTCVLYILLLMNEMHLVMHWKEPRKSVLGNNFKKSGEHVGKD